ncbi:MAG: DeoR/GlpR transcriptional regulator [Clostridia bacterium]|nr:DeoR/GlpR transcriptional regulator [Clostridia bacterium]
MDAMEQRRNNIVSFVNERSTITFSELKEAFPQVSDMTLRTDLKALDAEKKIIRIHGGAKAVTAVLGNDDQLVLREVRNVSEKEALVEKAVRLVRPNTTIFLDSGSTTTMLARLLPDQPMMVFTCSLTVAMELNRLEQAEVFVVGGTLNRNSRSMYGQTTLELLNRVRFDTAFLGVTGYDEKGFNCGHAEENALKRFMVNHADERVLLMDSSKVGKSSTFTFCTPAEVDVLVSDGSLPASFLAMCDEKGVKVL